MLPRNRAIRLGWVGSPPRAPCQRLPNTNFTEKLLRCRTYVSRRILSYKVIQSPQTQASRLNLSPIDQSCTRSSSPTCRTNRAAHARLVLTGRPEHEGLLSLPSRRGAGGLGLGSLGGRRDVDSTGGGCGAGPGTHPEAAFGRQGVVSGRRDGIISCVCFSVLLVLLLLGVVLVAVMMMVMVC